MVKTDRLLGLSTDTRIFRRMQRQGNMSGVFLHIIGSIVGEMINPTVRSSDELSGQDSIHDLFNYILTYPVANISTDHLQKRTLFLTCRS